jgi:CheY-like chemotaxis protein
MRSSKPILLVEDDDIDATIIERALKNLETARPLVRSTNGEEALEYLISENAERPCLILLDLNMPRMNGLEFLKLVKADDALKEIPVIVLTTSSEVHDIVETFQLSVAGYVVKPIDYEKVVEAIKTIDLYWTLSELPNGG